MGVMMLYTMHYPRDTILLFMILPVQIRFAMAAYVIWDLYPVLTSLAGERDRSGIAHAAHLGGLIFGFLYYRYQWRLDRFTLRVPQFRRASAPRPRLRIAPSTDRDAAPADGRVDEILAKISRTGRESLTDDERAALLAESKRIKRRNR
jgi:hypothetical protein